ncbi:MAG: GerAB/ArcD/ProY family transporter [Clostridia bacterium]|nr:GerAB/ArcD/ProY family transporter [Clostridia bacterium]
MVKEEINNQSQEADNITSFGYASFFITITKGFFLGIGTYMMFKISRVDTYMAAIMGAIASIITIAILYFIKTHSQNKDIIDLNKSLFGKVIGTILNIILCVTLLFLVILVLQNISQFVKIQYMPDTQVNYIRLLFLIPITYAAGKSIGIISRISQLVFFCNLAMLIASLIGLLPEIQINNLYPILKDGAMPPLSSAIIYFVLYSFPILLLTIIPNTKIIKSKHSKWKVILVFIYASFVLCSRILVAILILGEEVLSIYRFPEYVMLKMASLFEIIERMENTLAIQYLFDVIMFCIFALYFIVTFLKKKIKGEKKEKILPYILALVIFIVLNVMFKGSMLGYQLIENYIIPIVLVGIFVPMIITLLGTIVKAIKDKVMTLKQATS